MNSLVTQTAKNLPAMQETRVRPLGWEKPLEREIATHSSILAWEIPRTEEPGSYSYSPWGHKESDTTERLTHTHTHTHTHTTCLGKSSAFRKHAIGNLEEYNE